jgi:hypothetical protein
MDEEDWDGNVEPATTSTLKGWAPAVDNTKVRERIIQLATELENLAQSKEVFERQLV